MRPSSGQVIWAWVFALALVASCGVSGDDLADLPCPPDGTQLTFEGFGQPFLDGHCQRCHASDASPRNGAPPEYVFDTAADARRWADRIYARSAADNTSMPPGPDDPSRAERDMLAEWLACGAP